MPAESKKQQEAMAIALHEPDKLYTRKEGLKNMSKSSLHDFASTPHKGLPYAKKKKSGLQNLPSTRSSEAFGIKDTSSDDKY